MEWWMFFSVAGAAMALSTGLSGMATLTGHGVGWRVVFLLATVALDVALYLAVFRVLTIVLGLISWLYLVAQLSLYAAEVNVVRARRLWPRSIVQPPLTDADQDVLRDIARAEERRPEQRVSVGFEPETAQPRRPAADEPAPPASH
jgi:hypothetical protein